MRDSGVRDGCYRGSTPATGAMVSASAVTGYADCQEENCVRLSPDSAQSPVEQQSRTGDAVRWCALGTSAVALAVGWWVAYLSDDRFG